MSLGGGFSQAINDAVEGAAAAGVVFVVAAGNSAWDAANCSPASEPTALTVSALDDNDGLPGGLGGITEEYDFDDSLAWFSNYGEVVDLCAPGVAIYSTFLMSAGGYATMSGTSMASPHVAGAAALYIARYGLEKTAAGVETVGTAIRDSGWHVGHYAHFCDLLCYLRVLDPYREPLLNVAELVYWGEPPNLTFTAPTDATKVAGKAACAVGDPPSTTTFVDFYLDGQFLDQDTDSSDGWAVSWNTVGVADGPHTLVAVATDGTAQLAGAAVLVGVNNTASLVPSVRITQPFYDPYSVDPVPVSGATILAAAAADLGLVEGVEFYFGETTIGSAALAEGEWILSWDTTDVGDGAGALIAIATGADNSQGFSAPIPIAVRNYAVHAGGLTVAKSSGGGQWTATVTYTVHNAAHQPVQGATVFATWTPIKAINTPETVIPVSATTDVNGQCSFTQTFGKKYYAAMFELTSIQPSDPLYYYDAALNEVHTRLAINSP